MENIIAVSRKLVSRYYLDNYRTKEALMPDLNNMFGYIRYVGLSDNAVEDVNQFITLLKTIGLPYQVVNFNNVDPGDVRSDGDKNLHHTDLHYTLDGGVVVLELTKQDAKNALFKLFEAKQKQRPTNKSFAEFLQDYDWAEVRDTVALVSDVDYGYMYTLEDLLRDIWNVFEDAVKFYVVGSYFFKRRFH